MKMTNWNRLRRGIPDLTNWHETLHTSIATQFEDSYFSEGNALTLPQYFYSDSRFTYAWFKHRIEVLSYVAINHPNSIVRTKACIILSRDSNGLHSGTEEIESDIDILRELISTDWDDISYSITPRWCISILNCFAEHGDHNERVVANTITMLHNILDEMSSHDTSRYMAKPYKANDTFINSILRINQSLTYEVRLVTLTLMSLLGPDYVWHRGRFSNIANVWKMIMLLKLTSMESVDRLLTADEQQ
jgi:hypothetical protein